MGEVRDSTDYACHAARRRNMFSARGARAAAATREKKAMNRPPIKATIFAAILLIGGSALFFMFRRTPACSGDGKYMATMQQCQAYGIDAGVCREAIDKAREIALRAAPKVATLFECESRYTDCFEASGGGFTPIPSFCLKSTASGSPTEVRYLKNVSDRQNRKKAREVRID